MEKPRNPKRKFDRNRKGGDSKFKDEKVEKYKGSVHNDASWYVSHPQLPKDVGSFSFNAAVGDTVAFNSNSNSQTTYRVSFPGIFSIFNGPSFGCATGSNADNAAINIAAKNMYSFVRYANSGHTNYDSADLMLYLGALDSLYAFHAWMVRAYGVLTTYSRTNKYIGTPFLTANRINLTILNNLAQFRAYINLFATKLSAFAVPRDGLTFFDRHIWMYSNIYKDEDVSKAQFYEYVPAYFYKYGLDSNGAGQLIAEPCSCEVSGGKFTSKATPFSLTNLMTYGENLMNAVIAQEDCGIISGDILKAYGAEKLRLPALISEDYAVLPAYSEEVLLQIHNTEFAGQYPLTLDYQGTETISIETMNITQTTGIGMGNLISNPIFKNALNVSYESILDSWKETFSPEEVMVATRNLLVGYQMPVSGGFYTYITSTGSDICLFGELYHYDNQGGIVRDVTHTVDTSVRSYSLYFNEYPLFKQVDANGQMVFLWGELNTYRIMSDDEIANLHNVALCSQFGIPHIKA